MNSIHTANSNLQRPQTPLHPSPTPSPSPSSSKQKTLDKYKESGHFEDIDDDFDLSYSKFSHISNSRSHSTTNSGPNSGYSLKDQSPFLQQVSKLQSMKSSEINQLPSTDFSSTSMYPILERSVENDENMVLEPPRKPVSSFSTPDKIKLPKRKQPSQNGQNIIPFAPSIESTPKHGNRNVSVKVSLTPAQRVEKRNGIRSKNALENFQFEEMVGRGAFATVYKGMNLKTNQIVAIKQILLDKDQDVQGLMGEIDLLKILKHPNIVKYHGFVKTSDSLNVFLEFCAGGSLRQLYKRIGAGLPEQRIVTYVRQILQGLSYLHEQGVVHRDVKAANVLITETGDIKLADFGVATKVTSQHQSVVGTPNWMAPETVLGGEGLCTASDIWSLGATIIELFTTNPPYHDLNPMATLHAIGTDDHPPLPKNISSVAKDFLLECFQKQPSLRTSAKLLLKHKWLNQAGKLQKPSFLKLKQDSQSHLSQVRSINSYSENFEENWEQDFSEIKLKDQNFIKSPHMINITGIDDIIEPTETPIITKLNKKEVLTKFSESHNESLIDTDVNGDSLVIAYNDEEDVEDDDPFLNIELENFDTNDLEIQSKMEFLMTKFTTRVDLCQSGNGTEDVAKSLVKIMGKIAHLVKKYPISHDVLIRDHGILSIFELLENIDDIPDIPKLWYYSLSTLNCIFEKNLAQFEGFCLLGGIPIVTQFRSSKFGQPTKQQVIRFIRLFLQSNKALSMFISCGGLRVLSKLAEEDFETNPQFPLTSIDCLHYILTNDILSSKSDLCRKLSHYGVIFWFIVLLSRLIKEDPDKSSESVDKIVHILKFFGQSELKVRMNISSGDLFKLLFKIYPNLVDGHRLIVLKFVKSMSCIPEALKHLQQADVLEFLVGLIKEHTPSMGHYKEYVNIICPILYNFCYLNHTRESELVRLGALPYLKDLSKINLPFRQFVLPILCELIYCDKFVQSSLIKYDVLDVYLNLLLDPYWQANSLDSIINWYKQSPKHINVCTSKAITCLTTGFSLNKVSNLESALDNYLKLVTINKPFRQAFVNDKVIETILYKLTTNIKNSVVQLSLLRILKALILSAPHNFESFGSIKQLLADLGSRKNSLLVDELASEITSMRIVQN